ncbi:two-component regulator propeller domain-containing protein [Pseudoalteromonas sp. S16_S37]|uniref:two-component regulator propeller domain-containing protein n=1 Tax=Pseudoalteromonas sp. S16_S37 TaxID=2720228 RepID=UPI0016813466|nr:two-component regulator propeller domain-containing protein [Pseudoalteromonas sp. S16_S37]MBD1584630.1 GAF domain-containing protein [Pseudoalteromonas sp. S16_S37]
MKLRPHLYISKHLNECRFLWIFLLFVGFTFTQIAYAAKQKPTSLFELSELIFQTVGDDTVIPKGAITSLAQDKKGFIWIGTQFGLVRYDGYRFVRYEHDANQADAISGNFVGALWVADDGKIWVGTYADGVSVFDPAVNTFSHFKHSASDIRSLSNNTVRALTGDNLGNVYVATDQGLNHINVNTHVVTRLNNISGCEVPFKSLRLRSVLLSTPKTLWVGGKTGLCRITLPEALSFDSGSLTGEAVVDLNDHNAYRLFKANNDDIWVGTTDHGVAIIRAATKQVDRIRHVPNDKQTLAYHWVNSIAQVNNEMWLGTPGAGVTIVNAKTGDIVRHINHDPLIDTTINLDAISAILVDTSGIVWLGTWGAGLNRYNPHNAAIRRFSKSIRKENTLSHEDVRSFLELENGHIWVGNSQTGIDIIDPQVGVIGGFRPQPNNPKALGDGFIRVMQESNNGNVWVGTSNKGLYRYDKVEQRFYHYSKDDGLPSIAVVSLLETADQLLWVGTSEGVALMDLTTNTLRSLSNINGYQLLEGKSVMSIAHMTDNNVWVGTRNGLFVISLQKQRVLEISKTAGTTESLSGNYISNLLVDKQNRLLVATSLGLDRLVSFDGTRAIFESIDKLANRRPRAGDVLLEDELGRLWNGYGWISPSGKAWYDLGQGDDWLVGTIWTGSYTKLRDGTLLFGGTNGITVVRPPLWQAWDYAPPVVVSELAVNNQLIPVPEVLTLLANTKSFSFEFAALDYTYPQNNKYMYMLEGFDEHWITADSSRRRITYTRLGAGEYRLKIQGSNRNGMWSDEQKSVLVIQLPAWYETLWFKFVALMFAVTVLYGIYLWRVRGLQAQKAALDNLVQSRTANISMLSTIGQEITSTLHLESVLERVYKHVNELMNAQVFVVGILDKQRQVIACKLAIENGQRLSAFEYELHDNMRPAVWCVKNNKALFVNCFDELKCCVGDVKLPVSGANTESIIYLPLCVGNDVLGCVTVQSFQKNAFSENDVQMLRTIANYTAIALANADSVEKRANTYQELKETHDYLKKTQQQLIEQEKMAGLGRLVSGVAHEINTPLGISITASSHATRQVEECEQLLNSAKLTKPQLTSFINSLKESLKLQESSLERAAQLVKNFKQVAVDQSEEALSNINLSEYLTDVLTSLQPKWKHTKVTLHTDFPTQVRLTTYPGALAQILTNLIENAVRHGFDDGKLEGSITISLEHSGDWVKWVFADTGKGMDSETLSKVFEPFFTTHRATGTGLGMHIVYNIVTQKLKGKIECESVPNNGCVFTIMLPQSQ